MTFSTNTPWFDMSLLSAFMVVGHIVFGHFEEQTPRWRKLLKFAFILLCSALILATLGRPAFYIVLAACLVLVIIVHAWWLPKNGINGWTAEPKDKYYRLRGWPLPADGRPSPNRGPDDGNPAA